MKNINKQTEKVIEEFENKYTAEWWNGFGSTEDINKIGTKSIKNFIKKAFIAGAEAMGEACEIEKKCKVCEEVKYSNNTYCTKDHTPLNEYARSKVIREINTKKKEFLKSIK